MSDSMDVGQWAKQWEAMARQAQAAMSGNNDHAAWTSPPSPVASWFGNMTQANPFAGMGQGNPFPGMGQANAFTGGQQQSEALEHLLAGAQGYLGMLQSLGNAAGGQGIPAMANPFAGAGFAGMPSSAMANPFAAAMRGFGTQGSRGFDQMMEQFTTVAGTVFDKAKGALDMPAFGPLREKIEGLQKAARVYFDYQEQSSRYDRLMLKVSERAFAGFQLKLAEREEPGRQIDSARGLYDLWIDAAEEAYAEIALSEEFREVYAAVVDAQMRVRQHVQGEIEKFCSQLGMPTRSEVNSIGERLQALRREFREEREQSGSDGEMQAELTELRRELELLKSSRVAASKAQQPAKHVVSAESAKPVKPANPSRTKKAAKQTKAAKAVRPREAVIREVRPEKKGAATKPTPDEASKVAAAHREKRRKAGARKSDRNSIPVTQSRGAKGKDAAAGNSFAASIARFARKSKSASVSAKSASTKSRSSKQGGSK